jgi:hypothetical protein
MALLNSDTRKANVVADTGSQLRCQPSAAFQCTLAEIIIFLKLKKKRGGCNPMYSDSQRSSASP